MELSETKIKIFCNFAAYCRNNIFVLPMKIRLFTIPNLLTLCEPALRLVRGGFGIGLPRSGAGFLAHRRRRCLRLLRRFRRPAAEMPFGHRRTTGLVVRHGLVRLRPVGRAFRPVERLPAADAEPWMRYGGSVLCFVVAAFSALRLAKFNIDETQHTEFCGLPTPANALFFAALGWMNAEDGLQSGRLGAPADAGHVVAAHFAGEDVRFQVPEFCL